MRSSIIAAAVMAFASAISAQAPTEGFAVFSTPKEQELVPAGKPYTLKWAAGNKHSGAAVISLIGGETQITQVPIANLTTLPDVGVNQYVWNVDCSLGKAKFYGLAITLVNEPSVFQWSQPFRIDNSGCAGQSSSAASASASSSSATEYPTASVSHASSTKVVTETSTAAPTTITTKPAVTESHAGQTSTVTTKASTSAPQQTTTGAGPIPTAAAPKVAAGSFVLAGAAVAAVLAL